MKPASESKSAARRILACAAVALVAAAPAAWAQNSQRSDEGTGAPILSPPDTSAQGTGGNVSNGNTAAPPPATRMQEPRGTSSRGHPDVRTKPGGVNGAGTGSMGGAATDGTGMGGTGTGSTGMGGAGGSAGMGGPGADPGGTGAGAGNGRLPGAPGAGGSGTGSAGSSGY